MTTPPKYEELVLKVAELERRETALREELSKLADDCCEKVDDILDLQQRLTVSERRESEAREELLELSRKLDVFYSRSHGIKNLSEIEKANDKAKSLKLRVGKCEALLNMSRELLTAISRHGATTRPVDWCESFKSEVADRIEKIGAALKPAAEDDSDLQKIGFVRMNTKTDQPRISLADMQARYEDKP